MKSLKPGIQKLLIFLLFSGIASVGFCQQGDSISGKNNLKVRILPSVYFLPETRWAGGALVYSMFNWKSDTLNKTSNTQHYLSLTQNRQILFENCWQIFTNQNRWIHRGNADLSRFPEFYFGIGNHDDKPQSQLYGSNRYVVKHQSMRALVQSQYLGLMGHFERLENIHFPKGCPHTITNIAKEDIRSYGVFGIGPVFVFDNRDFVMTPSKGSFVEASFLHFRSASWNPFSILSIEGRQFIPLKRLRSILGFQAIFKQGFGEIPFRLIPALGGAGIMRGTYAGRYRDQIVAAFQAEIRVKIAGRFGVATFAGLGNMADQFLDLKDQLKATYGLGLRFRLRKHENVNLRIDYARGHFSDGLYIVLAEAF